MSCNIQIQIDTGKSYVAPRAWLCMMCASETSYVLDHTVYNVPFTAFNLLHSPSVIALKLACRLFLMLKSFLTNYSNLGQCCDAGKSFITDIPDSPATKALLHIASSKLLCFCF